LDNVLNVFEVYADADDDVVDAFNNRLRSDMNVRLETNKPKIDVVWISMMENTIEYLDNILRAPTRLIVNEEEVVKIEKIKKVTVESIKHLSKNAGLIEKIDEKGEIKPNKLLNVFKEETFNTYENRFIYTLIQKMMTIIRKEKKKLIKEAMQDTKEFKKIEYKGNSYNGKSRVDIQLVIQATTENSGKSDEVKNVLQRIKMLERNVVALTLTATYQELERERVSLITPPLRKNNVILKNVNFQYAAKLWDFLITQMDERKVEKPEQKVKEYKDRSKARTYVDETFLLDFLVLQSVENPEVKNKNKRKVIEQLIANVVEKTIDVNQDITEEQLKNLVARQFNVIKYKKQVSNKEIQDIFKRYISKYVQQISEKG